MLRLLRVQPLLVPLVVRQLQLVKCQHTLRQQALQSLPRAKLSTLGQTQQQQQFLPVLLLMACRVCIQQDQQHLRRQQQALNRHRCCTLTGLMGCPHLLWQLLSSLLLLHLLP